MLKKLWFWTLLFFAKRHVCIYKRPCDFFVDWVEYKTVAGSVVCILGQGFRCYPPVDRLRGADVKVILL